MLKRQDFKSSGGKGNFGLFFERHPRICAAGTTNDAAGQIQDCFSRYSLLDEVEALKHDSILPQPEPGRLPPLRRLPKLDMRNAGPFTEAAQLINPPVKTKFQTLVEDFKNTAYNSYWKKQVGTIPDPTPMLPENFDIYERTLGQNTPFHGRLYDVVLPPDPIPSQTPQSKGPAMQLDRKYCQPGFDPNRTYGQPSGKGGRRSGVKCCVTNENMFLGTALKAPLNYVQADFIKANRSCLGTSFAPNENIKCVPEDFTFGKTEPTYDKSEEWAATCEFNQENELIKKCLGHLNTLRKCLSKRYDANFFRDISLRLTYFDKEKTGWLQKEVVYNYCRSKFIRFDSNLMEPLLRLWRAFDGQNIEYKTFVIIINYYKPSPELPKIPLFLDDCVDFRTTYSEMVKYPQLSVTPRAGLPSGRYIDLDFPTTPMGCCKADRFYLPEESNMRTCINPSVLSHFGLSHRDMYTKCDKDVLRKIFEATGEKFTDENFNEIWNEAMKCHSQGIVCLQTFRNALNSHKLPNIDTNSSKVL